MENIYLLITYGLFWGIQIIFHAAQGFPTIPIKSFKVFSWNSYAYLAK